MTQLGDVQSISINREVDQYQCLIVPNLGRWQSEFDSYMQAKLVHETDGSHDLGHLRRVWRNCRSIAAEESGSDLLVLLAASYLHDLVNLPKSAPDRKMASRQSADKATEYLHEVGFPEFRIEAVAKAIKTHSYSAGLTAESIDAKILQDADRLDAIGAFGIARCFCVAGQILSSLCHPDDPFAENRELDDRQFAVDHFERRLFPIVDTLHTNCARRMGQKRRQVMVGFLEQLKAEVS